MAEPNTATASPAPPPSTAAAPAGPSTSATTIAPAPEGFVNVVVDGKHAVVPQGVNLIEAARQVNVAIPYFCYHPKLSIAGQCRMCLVETSDARGRLVAGCQIRVKEGLQIFTKTDLVKDAQRASEEFHLVNHPVDCAICDQSGECKLQDYYVGYDAKPSRIATYKVNKPKRKIFGPLVVYDGERCILCTRCVRFMNEIAKEPQIAMVGRGDHSEIDTVPGGQLDSKYSGNTVDICPVGALLNRDFRFTSRVWYLENERTVCDACANGCNVGADVRADEVYRYLPKRNEEVNDVWLCDDGRVSYHRAMDGRVETARIGRGDAARFLSDEAAVQSTAEALKPLVGSSELAVLISKTLTTEEMLAAAVFARDVLGQKRIYSTGRPPGSGDDFLIRTDKNPNAPGLDLVAKALGLELIDADDPKNHAQHLVMFGAEMTGDLSARGQAMAQALKTLVVLGVQHTPITEAATHLLPLSTHLEQEGTFLNYYGRLQRFRQAIPQRFDSMPAWAWVTRLSKALGGQWLFESAAEAFGVLAAKSAPLGGKSLEALPDTGVVLEGLAPAEYPARAPRPAGTK